MGLGGCPECPRGRPIQVRLVIQQRDVDSMIGSPNWEVRHGAAMGLRDIIKSQGAHGGEKCK